MHIERTSQRDLLELTLQGRLDNDSSVYFREEIEASAREGWHRILVDLGGVTYLSSSGIAALIAAKQRLDRLAGFFGIHNATPQIEQILRLTRLLDMLSCDPHRVRAGPGLSATMAALAPTTRFTKEMGLELEIYGLQETLPLACRVFGNAQSLFDPQLPEALPQNVSFSRGTFGLGLGVLGNHAGSSVAAPAQPMALHATHCGEFLAAAGGIAQSAHKSRGLPDYLLAAGDFVPSAEVLYGMQFEGEMPILIRFSASESDSSIGLSRIISCALRQTKYHQAAFVILADCAGLVGAQLRQSPTTASHNGNDRFALPGIREWLTFSAEQIHRHNLALIVGIAASGPVEKSSPLAPLLRPMTTKGELSGHFHAAVFPYRPLKKRILPLQPSVSELFESGSIEDVLHLLRDDRPISGLGESELFGGACWIGPIGDVIVVEEGR